MIPEHEERMGTAKEEYCWKRQATSNAGVGLTVIPVDVGIIGRWGQLHMKVQRGVEDEGYRLTR